MSKVNDFLTEAGVFYLATVDGDQPKVRPLGAHLEMDGKVLFGVGDFKEVYKQLVANPKVEIACAKPDGHWLRYTGKAVFETDPKYAEASLEAMPMLKNIAAICKENGIYCEISLEERMACGIGACLGCACRTIKNDQEYFAHVCKDGPVFKAEEVLF